MTLLAKTPELRINRDQIFWREKRGAGCWVCQSALSKHFKLPSEIWEFSDKCLVLEFHSTRPKGLLVRRFFVRSVKVAGTLTIGYRKTQKSFTHFPLTTLKKFMQAKLGGYLTIKERAIWIKIVFRKREV